MSPRRQRTASKKYCDQQNPKAPKVTKKRKASEAPEAADAYSSSNLVAEEPDDTLQKVEGTHDPRKVDSTHDLRKVEGTHDLRKVESLYDLPTVHQNFRPRYHNGCIIDCDVYEPSHAAAAVRLYVHPTKFLKDSHVYTTVSIGGGEDLIRAGSHKALRTALIDSAYRATFVLPELRGRDVDMVINMAHAAVVTPFPEGRSGAPLSLSPGDDVVLLQLLDEGFRQDGSPDLPESVYSRDIRVRQLIDVGFHIVGSISPQEATAEKGDWTADWVIFNGAIIFKAPMKALLRCSPKSPNIVFKPPSS